MSTQTNDTIVEEISIHAAADRVFDALISPAERVKWWGSPGRFQTEHMESDLRVGGSWNMTGIGPTGSRFLVRGIYREIDRPRLLVFTWLPDWQPDMAETLVRIDLTESNGVTLVRLTHSGLTEGARASHRGWPQILGWLQAFVEGNTRG